MSMLYTWDTAHAKLKQCQDRIVSNYMDEVQEHIVPAFRRILVEWMCQVKDHFYMENKTLDSAVFYLDAYLSERSVHTEMLQTVGITCMYIAAKMDEVTVPELSALVDVCAGGTTRRAVLAYETDILNTLQFQMQNVWLGSYVALSFCRCTCTPRKPIRQMATFLSNLCLVDMETLACDLEQMTEAILFLAHRACGFSSCIHGDCNLASDKVLVLYTEQLINLWQKAKERDSYLIKTYDITQEVGNMQEYFYHDLSAVVRVRERKFLKQTPESRTVRAG